VNPTLNASSEDSTTDQTKQKPADGPGSPGDAVKPFADALVTAARTAGNEPLGDPQVSAALQLGWLMDDILEDRGPKPFPADLGPPEGFAYEAQAVQLKALIAAMKLEDSASPTTVVDKLASGRTAKDEASAWQPKLAGALFGTDIRFAKAYSLGRQLNALAHEPTFSLDLFKQPRLPEVLATLDDLSTAFQAHASRGVANSIRRWTALTTVPANGTNLLLAQCELWRALLAGEKQSTELLEPENYLDAADRLAAKLRATATSLLKQHVVWVVLIGVLFVVGVAGLAIAPRTGGGIAAGLSSVLAAFGLSWKVIGGTMGELAARLEPPLWGGEVDGAVTDAVTLVHDAPPVQSIRNRRKNIVSGDYANRAARANAL
jgi:hypothetical protein